MHISAHVNTDEPTIPRSTDPEPNPEKSDGIMESRAGSQKRGSWQKMLSWRHVHECYKPCTARLNARTITTYRDHSCSAHETMPRSTTFTVSLHSIPPFDSIITHDEDDDMARTHVSAATAMAKGQCSATLPRTV
jgi:hypothetical protein